MAVSKQLRCERIVDTSPSSALGKCNAKAAAPRQRIGFKESVSVTTGNHSAALALKGDRAVYRSGGSSGS